MRISNKIHRGTSIAAAVIMLLTLVFGTASQAITLFANSPNYDTAFLTTSVVNLGVSMIANILLIVVLFRGKKDAVAGALFILTALHAFSTGVISNVSGTIAFLSVGSYGHGNMVAYMIAANMIRLIANLANVVFRVFLALECFKPGNVSGSKMKSLLIILPIVYVVITVVGSMIQNLYMVSDYGFGEYVIVSLVPAVIAAVMNAVNVIMGLAVSIPVYEKDPFGFAYATQSGQNFN